MSTGTESASHTTSSHGTVTSKTSASTSTAHSTTNTTSHAAGHDSQAYLDIVMFLFLALFIAQILKQIAPRIGLPFTSVITIVGFLMGAFIVKGRFYKAMRPWEHLNPHVMLMLFMPALIFESAFNTDPYIFSH